MGKPRNRYRKHFDLRGGIRISLSVIRQREKGGSWGCILLYRLRFTPVARLNSRTYTITFMSALPQTRHKIDPSAAAATVSYMRMWDENHILPRATRVRTTGKKKRERKRRRESKPGSRGKKKGALGPGGRKIHPR